MEKNSVLSHPMTLKDERITFAEKEIFPLLNNSKIPSCFPYQLQIDLTRFCGKWFFHKTNGGTPKDCNGCACPIKNNDHVPFATLKKLLGIFEKYGGKSIYLTGGGEPGNYPDIEKFLHYFADSGLELQVNTNGDFINYLDRPIIPEKIFSKERGQPIINISIHDNKAYNAVRHLTELQAKKQLYLTIRTTFMIHDDTTITEMEEFFISSENTGADIAAIRPYYVLEQGKRTYVSNNAVLQAINRFTSEWPGSIKIQMPKIDRLDDTDKTKNEPHEIDMPLCVSPFIAMSFNADMAAGLCCDTKETGVAGVIPVLFSDRVPENPKEYYLKALRGIVTLNHDYCVRWCGFTEYNTLFKEREGASFFYTTLKGLRSDYFSGRIEISAIDAALNSIFQGG